MVINRHVTNKTWIIHKKLVNYIKLSLILLVIPFFYLCFDPINRHLGEFQAMIVSFIKD